MSAKITKRLRREVRIAFRATIPQRVMGNRPWWVPSGLWIRTYHWLMFGQFARVPR